MYFVLIALWGLAIVILMANKGNRNMRWIIYLCFFSGLGAFCSIMRKQIIPNLNFGEMYFYVRYTVSILHSLVYVMAPYCMIMHCIFTSRWLGKKVPLLYRHANKIFLIPPILMYILFPVKLKYRAPFVALSIWAVPYCILANGLLLQAYFAEKNTRMKQQRLITLLLLTPATIFATIANYVLTAFGNHVVWEYLHIVVLGIVVIFIVGSVTFGAMGIRVRIEKYRMDSVRKTSTSGTSILSHTIKNEIMKISICADNVKYLISNGVDIDQIRENCVDDLKLIDNSSHHMLDMMNRIQHQLNEIILKESLICLNDLLEDAIGMVRPYLDQKEIIVKKNYEFKVVVRCDTLHVKEVLINILKNSVEAIRDSGKIEIHIYGNGKWITISITDDGIGIDKENLQYVLDPFFSTKRTGTNYGLGLSYCYNVMQEHGGNIEINSIRDSGTTVCLNFSARKVVDIANNELHEEVLNGQDKSITC